MTANPKLKRLVPLLLDWFAANARDLPWRRTRDPYAIWVSEIMLQQTQVKTVIPFWERWMCELPTIEAVAKAPSAKIHKLWEGLGYYTRVRNLQKAAQQIVAQQRSSRRRGDASQTKIGNRQSAIGNQSETPHVVPYQFPENFDEVLALPGIGRYTAGAICSIAFNQPTPILDGNVIRVLTRLFGIAENPKAKETNTRLWQLAEELVTHAKAQRAQNKIVPRFAISAPLRENNSCSFLNQSLMELGALICTPRDAQCRICPVKKHCVAFKEDRVGELPNLDKREAATARRFMAFAIENNGKFLVRQRPPGVVNAHLWEFPNEEVGTRRPEPMEILEELDALRVTDPRTVTIKPLCTIKHSITRYRITLEALLVKLESPPKQSTGAWRSLSQMRALAFTSAHRRLLARLPAKQKT